MSAEAPLNDSTSASSPGLAASATFAPAMDLASVTISLKSDDAFDCAYACA